MIQVLTPVLLFIALYVFCNVYNNQKTKRSFGWPFLGETLAMVLANWDGVPERFVQERVEKYGSPLVFKTSLLGERMAVLCGPAGHKFRVANENKLVGAWWPLPITRLLGGSLITTGGDEAKWLRRKMLSYLGPDAFATHYIATMDVVTRRHIDIHWRGNLFLSIANKLRLWMVQLN
ncbi:putative abieta-7,13-dien-18-ol hydroxylase [Helianthus anomalus]